MAYVNHVPDGWRLVRLGDVAEVNPRRPRLDVEPHTLTSFVPMVAVSEDCAGLMTCEEREYEEVSRGYTYFEEGDVLFSKITPCLQNGKHALAIGLIGGFGFGTTEFHVIRSNDDIDRRHLFRFVTQPANIDRFAKSFNGTAGQQRVHPGTLRALPILLPSLAEQRAIAHVLGTLDDKIELNRRMSETQEEMARALFKSWFVDFDPVRAKMGGRWRRGESLPGLPPDMAALFPDRLVDSELGDIPEGWRVGTVGDVATVVGGTTPSTRQARYWQGGTHCWATPRDLATLAAPVLLETERRITDAGLAVIGSGLLPRGTVLLWSRAPIGYLAIAETPVAINQGFIGILPRGEVSNLFMLRWCEAFHGEIVNHANGSTFLEIIKGNFRQIPVAVPDVVTMRAFDRSARPFYERIASNESESRTLAALRDGLLPKLVSGEVRVSTSKKLSQNSGLCSRLRLMCVTDLHEEVRPHVETCHS